MWTSMAVFLLTFLSVLIPLPTDVSASTPHSRISINGNANFTAANGVTGGSGSRNDPYIVEGWEVNDSTSLEGIRVQNTDAYFTIRYVYVHLDVLHSDGVVFYNVSNGRVESVIVSGNLTGISIISSTNITVTSSTILSNWLHGIFVQVSMYTTIVSNTISGNPFDGVTLDSSAGTKVYHNNFVNNGVKARDDIMGPENSWDDGYPSGGNYWGDYAGVDQFSGPNQNLPGSDGIGDTPYIIDFDSFDNYPLITPAGSASLPPSPPRNLRATAGNGTVTLAWDAPFFDGGSPIINYRIYRGTAPGSETLLTTLGNQLRWVDMGLTNGAAYNYEVAALNVAGESPRSNEVSATPATTPSQPIGLTVSAGDGQATLSWSPPADDGGSSVTNYTVYRGVASGLEDILARTPTVLTYTDLGLTNGVTYYYEVAAINKAGEGPKSNEANVTPVGPPSEPLNLRAEAGDHQVTLTWAAPSSDGGSPVLGYRMYCGNTSGGETFLIDVGNVLAYTETGLMNGQNYYYVVSALNRFVEGPRSNEVLASPASVAPREVEANYKPIVAVLFSVILLIAGLWASKKRPWKEGKDTTSVLKAFATTSLPFVLVESVAGVVSMVFEPLKIPPLLGWGTGIDCSVLAIGLLSSVLRFVGKKANGK